MPRISTIDPHTVGPEVRAAIDAHLQQGYRLTNEKLTLLHNVTAFEALEGQSYALDRELQRLIGKRPADIFEYAISAENDCLVCTTYFIKLLRSWGITDPEHFAFTEEEQLLIDYGRALARSPKAVPEELFTRLKARYDEETLVVLTAMGVFMVANNVFNEVLQVEAEPLG